MPAREATKTSVWAQAGSLLLAFGPMRVALVVFGFVSLLLMPPAGTSASIAEGQLVSTVLAPVLAPLIFMVLVLDMLMSLLFMSGKSGSARARYRNIAIIELVFAMSLFLFWLPYFLALSP